MTKKEIKVVISTMILMASAIKSGESFTEDIEDAYCDAMNILKNNR